MKKYLMLLLGVALGGCVAVAAPAISAEIYKKRATIVIQMQDLDSGESVYMACAPIETTPTAPSDFK